MNTSSLKSYAPEARKAFVAAITRRAVYYGLRGTDEIDSCEVQGDVAMIGGQAFPARVAKQREKLIGRIQAQGYDAFIDSVAYTWFNRFVALRFMEVNGYLEHGYRVLSCREGSHLPEIVEQAEHLDLEGLDRNQVVELKLDGSKDEQLYQLLIKAQCNALHQSLPFLFEKVDGELELLLPDNLLHSDSLVRTLVDSIEEEQWHEVEILGWLYQFFISERKDEVIGKVVKSEDIPAATQLFTPNWIVKYMVQNSLGAQWLATYPESVFKEKLEYYIEPAEQTAEVQQQLAAITPDSLNPEEITLVDPAVGSGHILVEAYDLFKEIYLSRGYLPRDIASHILTKNLYGIEIDDRAAQLASLALMFKARGDDRQIFERDVRPMIVSLQESGDLESEIVADSLNAPLASDGSRANVSQAVVGRILALNADAKTFGSLIQVPEDLASELESLKARVDSVSVSGDLLEKPVAVKFKQLVDQSVLLAKRYDNVVANPPYMGSKYHTPILKKFLRDNYKGYDKDIFSSFIDRDLKLSKPQGRLGFMSPFVWMFISSHKHLRTRIIDNETITSLVQLEYSGFDGATVPICTFTLQKGHVKGEKGSFIRLSDFRGSASQGPRTLEAIRNRDCGWFYEVAQDDFKKIPGSPIAYWVSDRMRLAFQQGSELGSVSDPQIGLQTSNNDRFLRLWSEVAYDGIGFGMTDNDDAASSGLTWFPYNKGGAYRKWSGNQSLVVNWRYNGAEIKQYVAAKYPYLKGNTDYVIKDRGYFFCPSVSWSDVTSGPPSFRAFPKGFIHDVKGMCAFATGRLDARVLLAYCNTRIVEHAARAINPTLSFQAGNFAALPFLPLQDDATDHLVKEISAACLDSARQDWNAYERSWDFQSLPILSAATDPSATFESSYNAWISGNRETIAEMQRLEEENNRLFIDAYGLQDELTPEVPIEQITLTVNPAYRYGGKLTEEEQWDRFKTDTAKELISYAIGCMMGRYSLDEPGLAYANSGNEGFESSKYTSFPADEDGIIPITDYDWFEDDTYNRLEQFLSVTWQASDLEANLTFISDALGPKKSETPRDCIRRYLATGFYKDHLSGYKKRPIYWLFSSGKQKAFQCLVYLHRYNSGTLSRMRTEYVVPLQGLINSRIDQLQHDVEVASSTSHRKQLERELTTLGKQREELQLFDEQLRHYADLQIELDLDDGVKVNYGKFGTLLSDVKPIHGKIPQKI